VIANVNVLHVCKILVANAHANHANAEELNAKQKIN